MDRSNEDLLNLLSKALPVLRLLETETMNAFFLTMDIDEAHRYAPHLTRDAVEVALHQARATRKGINKSLRLESSRWLHARGHLSDYELRQRERDEAGRDEKGWYRVTPFKTHDHIDAR